jgi:hypothetical protein
LKRCSAPSRRTPFRCRVNSESLARCHAAADLRSDRAILFHRDFPFA